MALIWNCQKYVCVIWFVFHVLQLLPIRFTQQNSCYISKPTTNNMQKPNRESNLPDLLMVIKRACFVDFLVEYKAPPNYVHH
jgi:hypothetical protein